MFWYLILAHLLGDYPFQPDWLVLNKRQTWALLLHGAIHFMFMFVLAGRVRLQVIPQLLALTTAHIIVDATKTGISNRQSLSVSTSYLLDQAIHLVLITLTTLWINSSLPGLQEPTNWGWAAILAGYVFVTYAWGTSERLLTEGMPDYNAEVVTQMWSRMATRAAFFTLATYIGLRQVNIGILAAVSVPYFSGEFRRRALITDLLVSLGTTGIVLLALA